MGVEQVEVLFAVAKHQNLEAQLLLPDPSCVAVEELK